MAERLDIENCANDFLFNNHVKMIERSHIKKDLDKSLNRLLNRIYYEITQIDYREEMGKFLEDGYEGMEIISHPKLCYLKEKYLDDILRKLYDELIKQHFIKEDTEKNRLDFLVGNASGNPDIIFAVHSDCIGGGPMTRIILNLTKPYRDKLTNGNVLLIHRELPKGVHFLSQIC